MSTIRWEQEADGVVVLTFDDPDGSANTLRAAFLADLTGTVARLEAERDAISGVVLASAKRTFFAGADLGELRALRGAAVAGNGNGSPDAAAIERWSAEVKAPLRRLETLGRPVVAALGGSALGGGLELALAAHHRIAVDDPKIQLGLPEVTLGLLPGAGGIVRTVRMLGVVAALRDVLLPGTRHDPRSARQLGLVDELVATREQLIAAAKAWIAAHPDAAQPWDRPDHAIPGGARLAAVLPSLPADLRRRTKSFGNPAPYAIQAAAVEGAQVDVDSALTIEGRYFAGLVTSAVAGNMMQAFFFDLQRVNGTRGQAPGGEPARARKVVVLGSGMMGAGIAHVCAKAGIEVVLKDLTDEAAARGKAYSERLLAKAVERGGTTAEQAAELLGRITPTADPAAAAGADLVIEAVFEDPAVKAKVFAEIEPFLAPDALLGSNTSTLPISELAEGVSRPADFVGLHFFSPAEKMPLLEIIKGARTSETTVRRALDLARQIRKTPIVVNDARGFFTSRVIITFLNEGLAMLAEGIPAPTIEQASLQAGYPAPVLALNDELNLALLRRIREAARAAATAAGATWEPHPAEQVVDRMLDELDRGGRLAGAGFYDYEAGRRSGLWSGLRDAFPTVADPAGIPFEELVERMLFIEALETIRCRDEGVIESVADANVGSILGIGYPGWTGGVLQYVNGYDGGLPAFAARAQQLADRHGERFAPPASLLAAAASGAVYTDER
ncbi:3-hydroxyacyl-CoA dehydrogenase NAD-binding domain-containing protein [Conexibacter stalactiti]|uniref:3-hydroxyacyl-CoA dehydrogenase NAD-binding domain-containing protein n=1 Tax=Conexibacter stalactiti TaxID=1940611 RepID=A0ABU4HRD6_9ACTN|nr:3-hydroxyacyl-CoA dehydrogenase NAD-binding domain-containing protein [Conexibacter stalactiti]MDW5595800.1 3-hydroxyacyl-CoA dehydrogenase NAD-binding domain-containing protein [Conexibacter stalactiti]MEC5036442.1 3-hydroxyacyl-CoA dehydrogenase NAD-binding domain-containing protein [Conexibacter stalactiti]